MRIIEVYKRDDGKWAWRMLAENGQTIATDGSQGYEDKQFCIDMANSVAGGANPPRVVVVD